MSKLTWGEPDRRFFEVGVDRGVFFPKTGNAVSWNGLIAVKDIPDGGDVTVKYFDGEKYNQLRVIEGFAATVDAFTYPDEFSEYDGLFGFSYRTLVGDASLAATRGYKIHLVYNALASPTNQDYVTLDDSASLAAFSWGISTRPEQITEQLVSSHLVIDTTTAYSWTVAALEDLLYGSDINTPRLPSPSEVLELFEVNSILQIIDNGDGSWTAIGPDDVVSMLDSTTFQINWPTAVYIDSESYTVHSL